jgi:hypothetical protein
MSWYEDPHTMLDGQSLPRRTRFLRKLRYKSASLGLPLTPNEWRIVRWKNRYRGKRAFLIGNGPSLKELDLRLLRDEITIGVNAIYLNAEEMGFLPTHHIVEDSFVAEDRAGEIVNLKGPEKWLGNYLRYCLGSADANWLNVLVDYRNYPGFPRFSRNAARAVWIGGTVSFIGMQLAYYMGVQRLYLVGFDHAYTIPDSGVKKGNEILSTGDDPNHFHADYFGKGYRWHDPRVDRMEQAYRRAKENYQADGREIFNATAGGKLEVFPRVRFASLFQD